MNKKSRLWSYIFLFIGILFIVIGSVLMIADHDFLNSAKYVLVSFICLYAFINMLQKKIDAEHFAWEVFLGLNLSIIGLHLNGDAILTNIMYFTGIVLFIIGLVRSQKLKSDSSL